MQKGENKAKGKQQKTKAVKTGRREAKQQEVERQKHMTEEDKK